eukprot:295295-Pyramimonas_sp.AAC.1
MPIEAKGPDRPTASAAWTPSSKRAGTRSRTLACPAPASGGATSACAVCRRNAFHSAQTKFSRRRL